VRKTPSATYCIVYTHKFSLNRGTNNLLPENRRRKNPPANQKLTGERENKSYSVFSKIPKTKNKPHRT
jgi:hypothetical protein